MFFHSSFSAIILAGGSSVRMGASKQHMILKGLPVIVRTLKTFETCRECSEIILVSKAEEIGLYENYKKLYGLQKIKAIVIGSDTRQKSAFNGLKAVSPDAKYIAIHDGARCLVTEKDIIKVFRAAKEHKAATASYKSIDTVKLGNASGKTVSTGQPKRENVYAVQTPQIFYADLYKAAAYTAEKDGYTGTDDCSLIEHVGFSAKLVECSRENIKITEPLDLLTAETILNFKEKV